MTGAVQPGREAFIRDPMHGIRELDATLDPISRGLVELGGRARLDVAHRAGVAMTPDRL